MQVQELTALDELERKYPRAFKLMKAGSFFLVVSAHEPYFMKVYEMIREQETADGNWTLLDEAVYLDRKDIRA